MSLSSTTWTTHTTAQGALAGVPLHLSAERYAGGTPAATSTDPGHTRLARAVVAAACAAFYEGRTAERRTLKGHDNARAVLRERIEAGAFLLERHDAIAQHWRALAGVRGRGTAEARARLAALRAEATLPTPFRKVAK